jgi:hypothetical protein
MGMLEMTGVDSVDSSSRQNATKNNMDRGVAGRSMMAKNGRVRSEDPARQRPALETRGGGERASRRAGAVFEAARRGRNRNHLGAEDGA